MTGWGAYGFELTGFDQPKRLLVEVAPGWPRLDVVRLTSGSERRRPEDVPIARLAWDDDHAVLWTSDTSSVELDRAAMRVQLTTVVPVTDDALAHPFIGLPCAVANHWLGRQVLHGGAVLRAGRAWCLLGTKEAGKSSTVAWFAARGDSVLADDLLVIDGRTLCAAPRCIDLREESGDRFGGTALQVLPNRMRWRVHLGPVPAVVPLGGLVYLEWGDAIRLEPVAPADRIVALFENSVLGPSTADAAAYLDLATLPTWRLVRPRDIGAVDVANAQLVDAFV